LRGVLPGSRQAQKHPCKKWQSYDFFSRFLHFQRFYLILPFACQSAQVLAQHEVGGSGQRLLAKSHI
jgi:hypothetical protein